MGDLPIKQNTGDVTLYDELGNAVNLINNMGQYNLAVSLIQNVKASLNNNSTSNINSGASFTGTSESTLGVTGIQVNFKSDKKCTVKVQQSLDGTNWDISDQFTADANIGFARTFQATASYFRIVVTNISASATTFLRLQVALAPVVECLPRALTSSGNLKVAIEEQNGSSLIDQGKAYSCSVNALTITNSEQDFFLLRNPPGSNLVLRILNFNYSSDGTFSIYRFYRNPSITSVGTSVTGVNFLVSGPASTGLAYHSPTISSRGTLLRVEYTNGKNSSQINSNLIRSLQAEEDLLITVDATNNAKHFLSFAFAED